MYHQHLAHVVLGIHPPKCHSVVWHHVYGAVIIAETKLVSLGISGRSAAACLRTEPGQWSEKFLTSPAPLDVEDVDRIPCQSRAANHFRESNPVDESLESRIVACGVVVGPVLRSGDQVTVPELHPTGRAGRCVLATEWRRRWHPEVGAAGVQAETVGLLGADVEAAPFLHTHEGRS